jgi:hypothetical protein
MNQQHSDLSPGFIIKIPGRQIPSSREELRSSVFKLLRIGVKDIRIAKDKTEKR